MGYIRFLLAAIVVAFHCGPVRPLPTISGIAAVEAFFVISGFYMSAAYLRNYKAQERGHIAFVSSRFLRLYPFYVSVLLATWILWATGFGQNHRFILTFFNEPTALMTATNLSMVGLDLVSIDEAQHMRIIVRPTWSISAELVFYALVPLLCAMRKFLLAFTVVAFAFKAYLNYVFGFRLSYFPFFSQIGYFSLGMFVYFNKKKLIWSSKWLVPLLSLFTLYVLFSPPAAFEESIAANIGFVAVLILVMPTCFEHESGKLSKFLGDMSYGVYLVHLVVIEAALSFGLFGLFGPLNSPLFRFCAVLLIAVSATALFESFVQSNLDAWRRKAFYASNHSMPAGG